MEDRGASKEKGTWWQTTMLQNTVHVVNVRGSPELKYYLLNKAQRGANEVSYLS